MMNANIEEVKGTVVKNLDKIFESITNRFEIGCNPFNKLFYFYKNKMDKFISEDVNRDLWVLIRYNLITDEDRKAVIKFADNYYHSLVNPYFKAYEELVGYDEYEIQYFMYCNNMTREEVMKYSEYDD